MFNEQLDKILTAIHLLLNCPYTFNRYKSIDPCEGITLFKINDDILASVKLGYPVKFKLSTGVYTNTLEYVLSISMEGYDISREICSFEKLDKSYNDLVMFAYATLNACNDMFRECNDKLNL